MYISSNIVNPPEIVALTLFVVVLLILASAAISDVRTREVNDGHWIAIGLAGIIAWIVLSVYQGLTWEHIAIAAGSGMILFDILWDSDRSRITSAVIYGSIFVLFLLPIPNFIINRIDNLNFIKIERVNPILVLLPTIISLLATSPPPYYYYTRSEGNLNCNNCKITVNYSQDEIMEILKRHDIVFDSIAPIDNYALDRVPDLIKENANIYKLNQLVIDNDTLSNLDFTMRTLKNGKTKIYFNGMEVLEDISTMKLEIKVRKYYRRILFRELKTMLNK